MVRVQDLATLQDSEDTINKNMARLREIEQLLADPEELVNARLEAEEAEKQLASLRRQLRETEFETTTVRNKKESNEKRLYSGQVTNPRELEDLQAEGEALGRRLSNLEDVILGLMIEVEEATEVVTVKCNRAEALSSRQAAAIAAMRAEMEQIQADNRKLKEEINELRRRLSGDLLAKYDALKMRKGGRGIARVRRNICLACGVQLPTNVVQKVQEASEIVTCTSCGRILCPD